MQIGDTVTSAPNLDRSLSKHTRQLLKFLKSPAEILEIGTTGSKIYVRVITGQQKKITLYFNNQEQLGASFNNISDIGSFPMIAVTICVNYEDYLKHCLPRNRKYFEKYYVITDSQNQGEIKELCKKNDVEVIVTDSFYDDDAEFNKGKATNVALRKIKDSWVCLLDADIILPSNFSYISKIKLEKDTIYGCLRAMCPSPKEFIKFLSNAKCVNFWKIDRKYGMIEGQPYAPGAPWISKKTIPYLPIGYFQLFHTEQNYLYPEETPHASKSDMDFSALWEKHDCISNIVSIHLPIINGKSWENHHGRVTPEFPEVPLPKKIFFPKHVPLDQHRSGWGYVTAGLKKLHHPNKGVLLDDFVESAFAWSYKDPKKIPYKKPWIGFIHNPHNMPSWFGDGKSSNQKIFSRSEWKKSLKFCKGLFTMSKYHRDGLQPLFKFPIVNLYHPTETPDLKFTYDKFMTNSEKKLIQVGWWLRKVESIHELKTKLQKTILQMNAFWFPYMTISKNKIVPDPKVKIINYLPNDLYDELLSENIVFLDLYDSSANNAIIECIVRNTPVLVSKLEPVVEYLGEDYPFYFSSLKEAEEKSNDFDLIYETYSYLENYDKVKFTREYFVNSFVESEIYKNL